jgi:hypothetical protein
MTGTAINSAAAAVRSAWSALELHGRALVERAADHLRSDHDRPLRHLVPRSRLARRVAIGMGSAAFATFAVCFVVWWLLATGPIPMGFATSWLTSAIEQRLGNGHRVEVGGTVLERDEAGRTALRLRDIVVRDGTGTVIASAPKAEVGLAGLLTGSLQADRLSLIGAEMALRIEPDGHVAIFAGAGKPSLSSAPAASPLMTSSINAAPSNGRVLAPVEIATNPLAALLGWIDKLDSLGLDGGALAEVGLKDCTLVVDDQRSGKRWTFEHINLSLTRPRDGGVAFAVNSTGADGLWSVIATVTPRPDGRRTIEAVVRDVSPKDLMLALRMDDQFSAAVPLSAVLRAEIGRDGTLHQLEGRVVGAAGYVGSREDAESRIQIDDVQLNLRWNAAARQLLMPLEARSGASRVSLFGQLEVPTDANGAWRLTIPRGVFAFASADRSGEPPLIIDRVWVSARIDPVRRVFEIQQGDLSGMAGGIAISGGIDFSTSDPRLDIALAGTRMTVSAFKRMWPALMLPRLREWIVERVSGGMVENVTLAANAPFSTLVPGGPPVPDDGLSVDMSTTGNTLRLVDGLPSLRDADLKTYVKGRTAIVTVGKAMVDLPSGRKLTLTQGTFEVPDTHPKPSPSRTRFRAEGSADAAAELLALERLRDSANVALDPETTKGTFVARVALNFPLTGTLTKESVNYAIEADLANFSAEKWVRGQKVEAAALKLTANNAQGFQTKGDVKIAGLPATIEYRKPVGDTDAEVRMYATLDDSARAKLGITLNETVTGPLPFRLHGRASYTDRESRYQVEADLKDVKVSELLPGWWKVAGKPAKITFTVVDKPQSMRFEDIVIEGAGTLVKGMIELDDKGEIMLASFPTFGLSDGDKATLRADRAPDGTLKVTMRGEVFDGRGFIKSTTSSPSSEKTKQSTRDLDIDLKLGTVTGYNGEPLRGVEMRMSRRNGFVRAFGMAAKLGRDAALMGDLRSYPGGRQVIYLETNDAGALFRFADTYARVNGGQMWLAMDPPNSDRTPQEGEINVRDFSVRNEPQLERVAASGEDPTGRMPQAIGAGVAFARMRVEFTRSPGRLALRDGVVWGPAIGATLEGVFDYAHDDVRLRGTFVPAYALNNFLARFPLIGFFLGGGQNEGVFGMPYEVFGTPSQPILRVNPAGMFAPGFLRKLFEFRGANTDDRAAIPPYASPTR